MTTRPPTPEEVETFLDETRTVIWKNIEKLSAKSTSTTLGDIVNAQALVYVGDSIRFTSEAILGRFSSSVLKEEPGCTGISASWCPLHGDCACENRDNPHGDRDDPGCPLHSPESPHGEDS